MRRKGEKGRKGSGREVGLLRIVLVVEAVEDKEDSGGGLGVVFKIKTALYNDRKVKVIVALS